MQVTIVKDYRGQEEIHKTGCRDLNRKNRPYRLADAMTMETDNLKDIYAAYWDCIADESVANGDYPTLEHCWYAWQGEFDVKPCAKALKDMEPPADAPEEAKPISKSEAKQDLARRAVMALSMIIEGADGSEAFLQGMDKAEAAQCLANWVHHLPTGRKADGRREWLGVLPRPERSDWK